MYELLDSETISSVIAKNPGQVEYYAKIMAEVAQQMHGITVEEEDAFPPVLERLRRYIRGGIEKEDAELAKKCSRLLDELPEIHTLIHGDFHTGNVFLQNGEPLLIDLDRLSTGHPMAEISDLYYFYVVLGENDPSVIENFMGFSYETSKKFFDCFLKTYLETDDEEVLRSVKEKASLLCYVRMVNKIHKKHERSEEEKQMINNYMEKIRELTGKLNTLDFVRPQ